MRRSTNRVLEPKRLHRILFLALPIIGGMVSQNILNLVDTAMVSRLENSSAALAAVGLSGFMVFVAQAIILGLSTGVQATASRRKGQGLISESGHFLNAALIIIVITVPILTFFCFSLAPTIYPMLNNNSEILALGIPYLQIRSLGMIFVAVNFAFRGYWSAIDLTKLYMITLISMHAVNIVLNYILIFGNFGAPKLGVEGAAIASVISLALGSIVYILFGIRYANSNGFLKGLPKKEETVTLIRLSLPAGVQQQFFAAGFLATFWIIGQMGTKELAAANVLVNIMLVALLPGMGFGMAAATLVGQALGKSAAKDASKWAWEVALVAMVVMALLGLPMILIPGYLVSSIYELEAQTLDLVVWPLRLVGLTMAFEALAMTMRFSLQGAGDTKRCMIIAIVLQWLIFLPTAYVAGPVYGYGLTVIWFLNISYRCLESLIFTSMWIRRKWARIKF